MTRKSPKLLQPRLRVLGAGKAAFGPGKAELLRNIDETGSIRSAASRMSMSYNRAWGLVRDLNLQFRRPLVAATRGGGAGGGASLTPSGRAVLAAYLGMVEACRSAAQPGWRVLRRQLR